MIPTDLLHNLESILQEIVDSPYQFTHHMQIMQFSEKKKRDHICRKSLQSQCRLYHFVCSLIPSILLSLWVSPLLDHVIQVFCFALSHLYRVEQHLPFFFQTAQDSDPEPRLSLRRMFSPSARG